MSVKVEEHGSTPKDLPSPVYRHSSETVRSQNDAGGKVPDQNAAQQPVVRKTR
jgi:hypothetical protein